jgi:hypothetical protein
MFASLQAKFFDSWSPLYTQSNANHSSLAFHNWFLKIRNVYHMWFPLILYVHYATCCCLITLLILILIRCHLSNFYWVHSDFLNYNLPNNYENKYCNSSEQATQFRTWNYSVKERNVWEIQESSASSNSLTLLQLNLPFKNLNHNPVWCKLSRNL